MIPSRFDYVAPASLDDAIALLGAHDGEAKILSGGQSLIPMLKLRLASPSLVVDINRIPGLAYVEERSGALHIGALAREADLEASPVVARSYTILLDTVAVIADPLVRNSATICGNIAHGDPANDHPATMLALDASFVVRGRRGERTIRAREFFLGLFTTALAPDEIVTSIIVPKPAAGSGGAYLKLERKVGDFATAGVAVQVTVDEHGGCSRAGIGLTNVGEVPLVAARAESFLRGKPLDIATIREAAAIAATEADPVADYRGSTAYKRDLVRVLATRALRLAALRAGGASAPTPLPFTYSAPAPGRDAGRS